MAFRELYLTDDHVSGGALYTVSSGYQLENGSRGSLVASTPSVECRVLTGLNFGCDTSESLSQPHGRTANPRDIVEDGRCPEDNQEWCALRPGKAHSRCLVQYTAF